MYKAKMELPYFGPGLALLTIMRFIVRSIGFTMTFLGLFQPNLGFGEPIDFSTVPLTNPYMFKISGRGGPTSYILGTYHYGFSASQLPSWVLALHQKTQVHAYELPAKDENSRRENLELTKKLYFDLDAAKMEIFGSNPAANNVDLAQRLETLGVPQTIAPFIQEENESTWDACSFVVFVPFIFERPYQSLDFELELMSHVSKKTIISLDDFALRQQAKDINPSRCDVRSWTLLSVLDSRRQLLETAEQYWRGQSFEREPAPGMELRNREWLRRLKKPMKRHSIFITVGVHHLYGRDSVLEFLRAQGFKIERMTGPTVAGQ